MLLGYILLLSLLLLIGMGISLPLILIRPYVCDWFYIFFFSVVVAWFGVDNWVLAHDLSHQQAIDGQARRDYEHMQTTRELHAQARLLKSVNRSLLKAIRKLERAKGGG
jgi:hypothetical protein